MGRNERMGKQYFFALGEKQIYKKVENQPRCQQSFWVSEMAGNRCKPLEKYWDVHFTAAKFCFED